MWSMIDMSHLDWSRIFIPPHRTKNAVHKMLQREAKKDQKQIDEWAASEAPPEANGQVSAQKPPAPPKQKATPKPQPKPKPKPAPKSKKGKAAQKPKKGKAKHRSKKRKGEEGSDDDEMEMDRVDRKETVIDWDDLDGADEYGFMAANVGRGAAASMSTLALLPKREPRKRKMSERAREMMGAHWDEQDSGDDAVRPGSERNFAMMERLDAGDFPRKRVKIEEHEAEND